MPVHQALQLVDSVVMPVGLYAAEFLTVLGMPESSFRDRKTILQAWENFQLEKINQRACRTLLSLHRRASRLACLGELGRYPMLLKGLLLSIKYNWFMQYKASKDSLIYQTYKEMELLVSAGQDCWLSRVWAVQELFKINLHGQMSPENVTSKVKHILCSQFEIYWKDLITDPKLGTDNLPHNKLRFYSELKSCFKQEPYLTKVTNRNQRSWIARVRTSAHNLAIEKDRYRNIPIKDRICVYCDGGGQHDGQLGNDDDDPGDGVHPGHGVIDTEAHFILGCSRFKTKRACFLKRMESLIPSFTNLSDFDKIKTILCPVTPQAAKLANKFMGIMFNARDLIDNGGDLHEYPTWAPDTVNPFLVDDQSDDSFIYNAADVTFASDDSSTDDT